MKYIVNLEGSENKFPYSVGIMEDVGMEHYFYANERNLNVKLVEEYPQEFISKLTMMLGQPQKIGDESLIFTLSENQQKFGRCIERMFLNLKDIRDKR
ncbi:MAG: hypothetical protein Q7R52_01420 [archaeon]|nr:hypothetical protein [archaeon]